ncbi:hypothetical protein ACET3Z_015477 [Daucus carota]
MALGLILGIGRAFRRKRASSLDILTSKRGPRDYYKGKNCKPTGFHTRKGGYVVVQEKLPNYVVPDLTDFKLGRKHSCETTGIPTMFAQLSLSLLFFDVGKLEKQVHKQVPRVLKLSQLQQDYQRENLPSR